MPITRQTVENREKQELEKPQEFRDKENEDHPQPQPSQLYPVLSSCGQSVTLPSSDSKEPSWVAEESVSAPPAYSNNSHCGPHFNDLCQTRDCNWGTPLQALPINLNRTAQWPLHWYPHEQKTVTTIRKAVQEDGLHSPYATQLIENFSLDLNTPKDWKDLCLMILWSGECLLWRAGFYDQCEKQAERKNRAGVQLNADCLQGEGIYASPAVQAQGPPQYLDQVHLCALRALKQIPSKGGNKSLSLSHHFISPLLSAFLFLSLLCYN